MSKTNHARGFKAEKHPPAQGDFVCGKRGERRAKAGAKKFVHSRHRASADEALRRTMQSESLDFSEHDQRVKFPSDYAR